MCDSFDEGLSKQVKKFLDAKPEARGSLVKPLQTTLSSYETKCKTLRDKYRKMVGDQVVDQGNSVSMMIHENLLPQLKTIGESIETIVRNPGSEPAANKIKTAMKNWSNQKDKLEEGIKVAVSSTVKTRADDLRVTILTCKDLAKVVNEPALVPFKKLDGTQSFGFDILNKLLELAKKINKGADEFLQSPTGLTLKPDLVKLESGPKRICEGIAELIAKGVSPAMNPSTVQAGKEGKR